MKLLLRKVHVLDPGSAHHDQLCDILIENGTVASIEKAGTISITDGEIIEGESRYVSTGWFDLHVHFNEPGHEYREDLMSGIQAAAQGGFTEVLCMPDTDPPIYTNAGIEFIRRRTEGQPVTVHPTGCLTVNREGKDLAELYDMARSGAVAFTDDQRPLRNAGMLMRALLYTRDFNGRVMVFADDRDLSGKGQMNEGPASTRLGLKGIPDLAESVMIARDLQVLEYTGGRLHFSTVSTAAGVALIREAKRKGLNVTMDVAVHHVLLTDEELSSFDTNLKLRPPLRSTADRDALIVGIADGTVDAVTTDHRPMDVEAKQKEFDLADFGASGLETGFAVLNTALDGKISVKDWIRVLTVGPRQSLGVDLPSITVGQKANLTMFDTTCEWTPQVTHLKSKSSNNPFLGRTLKGKPVMIVNGSSLVRSTN